MADKKKDDEATDAQAEAVRLQEERDKVQPSPTQAENDRAKVHGSEDEPGVEDEPGGKKKSASAEGSASYKTRDAKA